MNLLHSALTLCYSVSLSRVEAVFHEVSVYPKKELPFFILFTAGLCSFTAMLALLTHQFPELMGVFAKAVSAQTQMLYKDGFGDRITTKYRPDFCLTLLSLVNRDSVKKPDP